jgi:4-alpha-glucanotransferase
MKILQFAFAGGPGDASLPHTYGHNSVVYTGTHDNQTTVGWYDSRDEKERAWVCDYVGTQGTDVSWDLIRLAFASVADMAIAPLQDVLRLGDAARMNFPGRPQGNWSWRFSEGDITVSHIRGLRRLAETYDRLRASDADVSPEPASLSGALHTP